MQLDRFLRHLNRVCETYKQMKWLAICIALGACTLRTRQLTPARAPVPVPPPPDTYPPPSCRPSLPHTPPLLRIRVVHVQTEHVRLVATFGSHVLGTAPLPLLTTTPYDYSVVTTYAYPAHGMREEGLPPAIAQRLPGGRTVFLPRPEASDLVPTWRLATHDVTNASEPCELALNVRPMASVHEVLEEYASHRGMQPHDAFSFITSYGDVIRRGRAANKNKAIFEISVENGDHVGVVRRVL